MMNDFLTRLLDIGVEAAVVLVGLALSLVLKKVHSYLDTLKEKDKVGIIDMVTDRAVDLVRAELSGASGAEKLAKATEYASKFLAEHGIRISADRLRADIENGVSKLPYEFKDVTFSELKAIEGHASDTDSE